MLKLAAYYAGLVALVAILIRLFPQVMPYLPLDGLSDFKEVGGSGAAADFVTLITQVQVPMDMLQDSITLTISLVGALLIMIPLRWVYLAVGDLEVAEDQPPQRKVSASLLLLPLVVTAIIAIVKFSLALAFSLAGIFAAVRYRTTLKNLTDALFVFASMAVGLAAGAEALGIAFALSVFFAGCSVALEPLMEPVPDEAENPADSGDDLPY